ADELVTDHLHPAGLLGERLGDGVGVGIGDVLGPYGQVAVARFLDHGGFRAREVDRCDHLAGLVHAQVLAPGDLVLHDAAAPELHTPVDVLEQRCGHGGDHDQCRNDQTVAADLHQVRVLFHQPFADATDPADTGDRGVL